MRPRTQRPSGIGIGTRLPLGWLWLSVPIAVLAMTGSVIGIVFEKRIYGRETANWAAQSIGQDIANLVAFPALLLLAFAAGRGSLRAYLAWTGLLVYSAYTYAIYVFDVRFGPLFLVWVAVFGLSVWTLVGAMTSVDPVRVRGAFTDGTPVRSASALLITIGAGFSLVWLSEIVPAIVQGNVPEAVREAGLPTNPVHVLDLALFLPAAVVAGTLLRKRRPWGYVLAPVILVAMVSLAVGIVSLMVVLAARDLAAAPGVGLAITGLAAVELVVVLRLLGAMERAADVKAATRVPEAGREG